MVYYIEKDGRWISIFITSKYHPKDKYGDIIGEIYNIRRRLSHKKLRLCWKNVRGKKVNEFTNYCMSQKELKEKYEGPFTVNWKY